MQDSLTWHRDLRTGRSIWMDRRRDAMTVSPMTRGLACDVLVVGAGVSGALIAESLASAGLKVVVVDRRGPAVGSTIASTAMLQYELDTPMINMTERIGRDRTERLWRRSRLAVDALRERTERLGIAADAVTRGAIYLDGNVLDADGLAREADARRRAGFEVELLKPAAVKARFGISGRHAILSFGNYTADPRRLATGYLNAALAQGARMYAPVEIVSVDPSATGVVVRTTEDVEVRAGHMVVATGYELMKGIPRKGNKLVSSWSISTKAQPRNIWPTAALIWEAADPYLYIRTTSAGEVICGGEDEEISNAEERDAKIAAKTDALARKLAALLPELDVTPTHAWAGTFGDSPVGTPTVGRIPGMPNCYAAMGFGGNGITFSMMAAQVLRGLIMGTGDADSDLVSFYRDF